MNKELRQKVEAFLQEIINEDSKEDDDQKEEFVTKWVLVIETQSLDGNKTIRTRKSDLPPWDALGLMEWAVECYKDKHRH